MLHQLRKLLCIFTKAEKKTPPSTEQLLNKSLAKNIACFKAAFNSSIDLTIREINVSETKCAIITMEGMVDKKVLTNAVISPITKVKFDTTNSTTQYNYLRDSILASTDQTEVTTFDESFQKLASGFALVCIDRYDRILAVGVQGFSFRSVSEPAGEMAMRGSQEGFVEPLRVNITLIRRRIKSPKLKFETITLGSKSKTDVCLCYLTDIISPTILRDVREKIKKINLDTVLASGYIAPYLDGKGFSIFSGVGMSERPDTVCGKISEGRIAVLIDGTPSVLIVPYLFVEYFQTLDDYSVPPYFATLTRWLKYLSFLFATILPGMYVTVGTFNPELFPEELITKIAKSVSTTPFPLIFETLFTHILYELMREAGLRLPRNLGHAVSIVGALVIGESAVSSGLMGAPTLIIIAVASICSYVIPNLYEPISLLRIVFIIVGGLMGLWGLSLVFCVVLINICSKNNLGVPFGAPVSPFKLSGMRDVIIRASWKSLGKTTSLIQEMPGSNITDKSYQQ